MIPLKTVGTGPFSHTYAVCPACAQEEAAEYRKKQDAIDAVHKAWIQEGQEERLYRGIPPRFKEADLKDFTKIEKVLGWVQDPREFFLVIGPCGIGKSRLACAVTIALRKREIPAEIMFSPELFLSLRRSFNRNGRDDLTEFQIIDSLIKPQILICDDIGVQKQTEYVIEAWYNVIDARYRNCKATFFTSNLNLREISACMTDRIASRLLSGTVVTLSGKDRRGRDNP